MKLDELIQNLQTGGGPSGPEFEILGDASSVEVDRITDDSRELTSNSVFAITALSRQHLESALLKKPALIIAPPVMRNSQDLKLFAQEGAVLLGKRPARSRPEWILARLAGIFYQHPDRKIQITAVTGTNGKTSISRMLYHAWKSAGENCGVIGTLGATYISGGEEIQIHTGYTTPRSYQLLALLKGMSDRGVQKVALEASSEALALGRLETIHLHQAIFCGLSVDHLDYHRTMSRYFMAKIHLFTLLARSKGTAIIQDLSGQETDLHAKKIHRYLERTNTEYRIIDSFHEFKLNAPVEFNQRNANLAWQASGLEFNENMFASMPDVPGRMNRIAVQKNVDAIIDYAHTPDALRRILEQLKEQGYDQLICVFGCGGNRDSSKRVLMGRAAMELATEVIVTDDNPRKEDPSRIRSQIMKARELPDLKPAYRRLLEIPDRREAIQQALEMASSETASGLRACVLIAGKGHEDYQIYGTEKKHFSDYEVVEDSIKEKQ
ncbi:MAG TPA: hypothetical protein DEA96_13775 [Leptospiraceae bacterium]|nr:hypothetical protein [Spirochaetaceae bacterium]HBS06031.1 hypothetical protein [Leptospiraceae bacterium]|tara:strand:- start:37287 stop:38771 length:1485 start_codon:yes stop_codon:yes gene_type:complete